MQVVKPFEVNITAIHYVDGPSFRHKKIEDIDIVKFAVGNMDKTRDIAPQIKQRVHLHRSLGRSEVRPGKDRQAQVDGRRVEGIDGIRKLQTQVFVGVQLSRPGDQTMSQFCVDAPVARLVLAAA